ncbi:MAG: hypothetical protein HY866_19620 [Chloroflexi bacterium]|nr:hypothetical protein [Chloroflexota bacterium]
MDDNKSAMLGGVVFLVVALIVAGYFGYQEYTKWAFEKEFGQPIISMCANPGTGQANEFYGPDKPKPWRAVVVNVDRKDEFHGELPSEARADKLEQVDVVVCRAAKGRQIVEECPYMGRDGTQYVVRRYVRYQDFIVLNPTTGQRVANLHVLGAAPTLCPDQMYVDDKPLVGKEPGFREFYYSLLDLTWR